MSRRTNGVAEFTSDVGRNGGGAVARARPGYDRPFRTGPKKTTRSSFLVRERPVEDNENGERRRGRSVTELDV